MRALPSPAVQLITGPWRDLADLERRVRAALDGGLRWLQLRARGRSARDIHEAAALLAPLLRDAGAMFVVNDRVDVALAVGADGVHLPEAGMSAADARRLLGDAAWIARSVHSVEALHPKDAQAASPLDAVQFGPIFDTASKRKFGPPQGLDEMARAAEAARRAGGVPLIAVGGLDAERATACRGAGAGAVAVIGAIWEAGDISEAAARFTTN